MRWAVPILLIASMAAGCATTAPLWSGPVPTYQRPDLPALADDPTDEVTTIVPLDHGDPAPGGGLLIPTSEALVLSQLADVVLPACETSAAILAEGWTADRALCDRALAGRDEDMRALRVETIGLRVALAAVAIVGSVAVAAAWVGGYQLGAAP